MKRCGPLVLFLAVALGALGQDIPASKTTETAELYPEKIAEDLWGDKVGLGKALNSQTVTLVPFSTSNCGYCLVDGYYGEQNYILANEKQGGISYHQCLFNPQLDICAFQKHFGWESAVLTYPPSLHRFHDDGFPALLAFKGGKQVLKDFYNYALFDTLKQILWDSNTRLIPTGNLHMAERFIYENERMAAVMVFPRGADVDSASIRFGVKTNSFICRNIDELLPADLKKHLYFAGNFSFAELNDFFSGREIPFKLVKDEILLGDYAFSFDSTGIYACFPNPINREKFIIFDIAHGNKRMAQANFLDFMFYSGTNREEFKRLAYGHFDKSDPLKWKPEPKFLFSDSNLHQYCKTTCPLPLKPKPERDLDESLPVAFTPFKTVFGKGWTMGNNRCRFPAIITREGVGTWVTWEESGNILLSNMEQKKPRIHYIENDKTDSYNPCVAIAGRRVWVFWLNNRDGYYRVYGRYLENNSLSDEILISATGPADAVTLTGASSGNNITVAWSEWKANFRFLKMRSVNEGTMEDIREIKPVPSRYTSNYTNTWYPSLCLGSAGKVFGAWNQHYPGTFCICGGDIAGDPQPITHAAEKMEDWEIGGYPSICIDSSQWLHAVWESNGWEVYWNNKPQQIRYARFNDKLKRWSLGENVSGNTLMLNQTPVVVTDRYDNPAVIWSGRDTAENKTWKIYISLKMLGGWSDPICLSEEGVTARHPKAAYNSKRDELWVSWHAGEGDDMKTRVLKLRVRDIVKMVNSRIR